tara:strand:+ start:2542 stop:3432 length:891 start_codon:yes stop_codon:yes gene_type:complete
LSKKTLLITGTSGFIGYKFLKYILTKNYLIIDILREKNKKNSKLKELKKKYPKNYRSIFFSDYRQLERKIKKLKINYFVNFATLYKNGHEHNDIFDFIKSNILFPTLLYDLISKKANKIINFGSMMQHDAGEKFQSKNFYSATKNAFEMISNFYKHKEKSTKFYNLKLYESFGENDNRKKLIPTIIGNYKKRKTTVILSKNLELNIIHVDDIIKALNILLNNNIKPGSYCLKNNKNIKISNLINNFNRKLERKIKVKYLRKSVKKISTSKIKKLPKWKPDNQLVKKIELNFINEKN